MEVTGGKTEIEEQRQTEKHTKRKKKDIRIQSKSKCSMQTDNQLDIKI
jgi:hypothetical protein